MELKNNPPTIIIASVIVVIAALMFVGSDPVESTMINVPPSKEPSLSTGVLTGGVLSTGGGSNQYSISNGTGVIVEPDGTKIFVSWSGKTNIVPTNLATNLLTWVSIDENGNVLEKTSKFTTQECRVQICLGVIVHVNKIIVDNVNNEQIVAYNVRSQLNDLSSALGFFNVEGNVFSANGANLKIDKSVGKIYAQGSNYNIDSSDPNIKTLIALSPATFQYRFSNGDNGVTGTDIDPDNLDNGSGGDTPVGVNKWSIQRIYSFVSNNVKIQKGTAQYGTADEAVASINTELSYITEPSILQNGILRGWLVVKQGATALNGADAVFIEAGKFGDRSGAGGGGGGGGEANTYSNSGHGDGIIILTKSGVDLPFRGIASGSGITVTNNSTDVIISATGGAGEANTASNIGLGQGVFAQKNGVDLEFKNISCAGTATCSSNSTDITITTTGGGGGEANTASNVGTGVGVFDAKNGVDLEFNSIIGGQGITVTDTTQDITIDTDFKVNNVSTTCSGTQKVSSVVYSNSTGIFTITCSTDQTGSGSAPRGGYMVAHWAMQTTKTNIGTNYVDIITGANSNGDAIFIDTDTFTQVRMQIEWNKIGAGTQNCQLVTTSGTQMVAMDVVSGSNDSGFVSIPAGLLNAENNYKIQCKSTTATDDPIFYQSAVWLK